MSNKNLFMELEVGDISKVIVPAGKFTLSDVFAVALLKMVNPDIQYIRKDKVEPEDLEAKDTLVVNIGGDLYDYHQPFFEMDSSGNKMTGFRLLWRELSDDICGYGELADFLDDILIKPIDYASIGLVNTNIEANPLDVRNTIQWILPNWNEETEESDLNSFFETAMVMAFYALSNAVDAYKSREKALDYVHVQIEDQKHNPAVVIENDNLPPIILEYATKYIQESDEMDDLYLIIRSTKNAPKEYENGRWDVYYCDNDSVVRIATTSSKELALQAVEENKTASEE